MDKTVENKADLLNILNDCPIIAIVRGITPPEIIGVCEALLSCGIRLIEVPMNSPAAIESIALAAAHFKTGDVLIGAGTVLDCDQVNQVADAGGKYIISPNSDAAVIKQTKSRGLVSCPGFLTPTEAFAALAAGADILKCFPAADMGIGYLKNLKAVCPAPILAVGGIGADNAVDFLSVTAGLGIGSSLYRPQMSLEAITENAARIVKGLD